MREGENPEQAAHRAVSRWRYLAIGLALVGFTNLVNIALNMLGLHGETAQHQPVCVTVVGVPILAEKPRQQDVDRNGLNKGTPSR